MSRRGFTLIEMVVVVVIIAVIATIAIPRLGEMSRGAACSSVLASMRELHAAVELYRAEHGDWPPDGNTGAPPDGFEDYAPIGLFDGGGPPVGGLWDFENESSGFVGVGIHFRAPNQKRAGADEILLDVDRVADDGDTTKGGWRFVESDRYYIVFEEP